MDLFVIGKTQHKEEKKYQHFNFHIRQYRPSCERLRKDLTPIPGEIGTVVESAASHSFLQHKKTIIHINSSNYRKQR